MDNNDGNTINGDNEITGTQNQDIADDKDVEAYVDTNNKMMYCAILILICVFFQATCTNIKFSKQQELNHQKMPNVEC